MSDTDAVILGPIIRDPLPMHLHKTIEMKVTLSDETLKEIFAAVLLHKLADETRTWPEQFDSYASLARELADRMMKARKEEA